MHYLCFNNKSKHIINNKTNHIMQTIAFATMYDQQGNYTSNCRVVYAKSKKQAAEMLNVKTIQVYKY